MKIRTACYILVILLFGESDSDKCGRMVCGAKSLEAIFGRASTTGTNGTCEVEISKVIRKCEKKKNRSLTPSENDIFFCWRVRDKPNLTNKKSQRDKDRGEQSHGKFSLMAGS
ncbi:hypothetical protein ABW19_dt0201512 [Dactylella cylindrospora]|nr:hypothetical protein ABW19_dt0201512 [Dactylella cylindrospora]